MSFWDNHKDQFKSAGIATVTGIGSGAKSLGKAGVKTYKNYDAKKKGQPIEGSLTAEPTSTYAPLPKLSKEQLASFQAPPRRNVDANGAVVSPQYLAQPAQPAQLGQPTQVVRPPQATPAQAAPPPPPRALPTAPTAGYTRPAAPPPGQLAPILAQSTQPENPPATLISNSVDSSRLPQPPIHQARGLGSSTPQTVSRQNTAPDVPIPTPQAPAALASPQGTGEPPRKPIKYEELDLSKVGPPPPKYMGPAIDRSKYETSKPSKPTSPVPTLVKPAPLTGIKPVAVSAPIKTTPLPSFPPPPKIHRLAGDAPPPPPSRSTPTPPQPISQPPRATPTPPRPAPAISPGVPAQIAQPPLPPRTSSQTSTPSVTGKPKKTPPPKPQKLRAGVPPPPYVEDEVKLAKPTPVGVPNFAEQIASLNRNVRESDSTEKEVVKTKPTVGPKPVAKPKPEELNQDLTPEPKPKPELKPKPEIKTTPEIKEKPSLKPKPESKPDLEVKAKPEVKTKPELKPKPTLKPKPEIDKSPSPCASPAPPPPPPRNYQKPAAPPSQPPQLDLEISTGWFATNPLQLPKDLQGLNYSTSYLSSRVGPVTSHTRTLTAKFKDLAQVEYRINWTNDNVAAATVSIDKFTPSPLVTPVPKSELLNYHNQFSEYVASWAEHKMGQQVGRGECWDLAQQALLKGCGKHAFVSTYTHHGYPVLHVEGSGSNISVISQADEIRRGDVLQFYSAKFVSKTGATASVGAPDHTSVVLENQGDKLVVAEQNVNGVRSVCRGEYVVRDLVLGKLVAYRAVPAAWSP